MHTGCTTGFEAQIAGHPTISLRPGASRACSFHTSDLTNVTASSEGIAAYMVRDYLYKRPNLIARARPALDGRIAHYFTGLSGPFAFEKIAGAIVDLFDSPTVDQCSNSWHVKPGYQSDMDRPDLARRKIALAHDEFDCRLALLQSIAGVPQDLQSHRIGESLFLLRRRMS